MDDLTDVPPMPGYSPWDFEPAHHNFNAMCGHGALAAALGREVSRVMGFFTEDGFTTGRLGGWVNIPMMKAAIAKAGYSAVRVPDRWPPGGALPAVVMIQWIGPWMNPGVPAAARCQHRHWVAYQAGWIWDVNTDKWQRFEDWLAEIVPQLLPKKATAWTVALSLILTKKA